MGKARIRSFDSDDLKQQRPPHRKRCQHLQRIPRPKRSFDSNDSAESFSGAEDTSAYYILGYTSSNHAKNGRFRHIKVVLKPVRHQSGIPRGYYARRDFEHSNRTRREQQIQDELASDLPATDVAVYAGRISAATIHIISRAIRLSCRDRRSRSCRKKDKDSAMRILPEKFCENGKFPVRRLRDTVKLAVDSTENKFAARMCSTNTSFCCAGKLSLEIRGARNRTGRMGTFETDVQIPDLRKVPLRQRVRVVLSSLRVPATAKTKKHPLVGDQTEFGGPTLHNVFTQDQHLYLQFEVYDPARGKSRRPLVEWCPQGGRSGSEQRQSEHKRFSKEDAARCDSAWLTSVDFSRGDVKVYEFQNPSCKRTHRASAQGGRFQLDLPCRRLSQFLHLSG